jgi:tungstate transport system substrate-binding protein
MNLHRILGVFVLLCAVATAAFATGQAETPMEPARLRLATTTSTENSGLLAELLPPFEQRHNVIIDVIAVGTGQALELGRNGDVDMVMVHAPGLEREFVDQGYGVERVGFMYNDFVILGPAADPAGIAGSESATQAFQRVAAEQAPFISRGDNSGTHTKERGIWAEADVDPAGAWYREAGQGMGAVITIADNEQAYTLADRGTFLAYRSDIDLAVVVEGDPILFNPYAMIAVNPERHPHVQRDLAQELIDFIVSEEGQQIIGSYRVSGEQLFTPDA